MPNEIQGKPRGFAALTPEQRRDVATRGGRAAHASGHAHQYTPEEGRAAAAKRQGRNRGSKAGSSDYSIS